MALAEFAQLKADLGDKIEVGSVTYNETMGQKVKRRASGWFKKLPLIALGAGSLGLAVASAGLLSPLAAVGLAGLAAGGASFTLLGSDLSGLIESRDSQGLAVQHTTHTGIELPQLTGDSSPEVGLRAMSVANMERYPGSLHVLHVNGHGHGANVVAGMDGTTARTALSEAVERSGRKFDVGFYETCYGANWEMLHGQASVADYAVAFEDMIPMSNAGGGRLDLSEILSEAVSETDGRAIALKIAGVSAKHFDGPSPVAEVPFPQRLDRNYLRAMWTNTDSTTVVADLQAIRGELSPALNEVGRHLMRALESGELTEVQVREAHEENRLEKHGDLVDLGGFLHSLKARPLLSDTDESLAKALQAIDDSLLFKRTGEKLPLSGLSFHVKPSRATADNASSADADSSLPENWLRFVKSAL